MTKKVFPSQDFLEIRAVMELTVVLVQLDSQVTQER